MKKIKKKEKPLITFVLVAYNHEQYIHDAVEGALSQTYSPLEIILSDDCSTDLTFEIMQEIVKSYNGSHNVVLTRNRRNLGLAAHLNKIFDIGKGELFVLAAGDDISFPRRSEILYEYWEKYGRPGLLVSDFVEIDTDGVVLSDSIMRNKKDYKTTYYEEPGWTNLYKFLNTKGKCTYVGATQAVSAFLRKQFGPIDEFVNTEDATHFFRSLISGGRLYIPIKVVKYRVHKNSLSFSFISSREVNIIDGEKNFCNLNKFLLPSYQSYLNDLKKGYTLGLLSKNEYDSIRDLLISKIKISNAMAGWREYPFLYKVYLYFSVFRKCGSRQQKKWALKRLAGMSVFISLVRFKQFLRFNRS